MPESEGWTGGENKTGVAVFVPKLAFTGESSTLRRCQFLLTGILYFCAFLPKNTMQLTKTAPRVTLSRVGIKIRSLTVIYPTFIQISNGNPEIVAMSSRAMTAPSSMTRVFSGTDMCRTRPVTVTYAHRLSGHRERSIRRSLPGGPADGG